MLYIVCGLPRNGKSVYLTRQICKSLQKEPELTTPIYVNWDVRFTTKNTYIKIYKDIFLKIPNIFRKIPYISRYFYISDILHDSNKATGRLRRYSNFEDLLKLKDADIYIDEMGGLLFNRDWKTIPSSFIKYLQQHGKKGIDIFGATQSIDSIEINFRRLSAGIAIVSKVFKPSILRPARKSQYKGFPLFKVEVVDRHPYLGDKQEEIRFHSFFWARKKYLNAFDTKQDIVTKEY